MKKKNMLFILSLAVILMLGAVSGYYVLEKSSPRYSWICPKHNYNSKSHSRAGTAFNRMNEHNQEYHNGNRVAYMYSEKKD